MSAGPNVGIFERFRKEWGTNSELIFYLGHTFTLTVLLGKIDTSKYEPGTKEVEIYEHLRNHIR